MAQIELSFLAESDRLTLLSGVVEVGDVLYSMEYLGGHVLVLGVEVGELLVSSQSLSAGVGVHVQKNVGVTDYAVSTSADGYEVLLTRGSEVLSRPMLRMVAGEALRFTAPASLSGLGDASSLPTRGFTFSSALDPNGKQDSSDPYPWPWNVTVVVRGDVVVALVVADAGGPRQIAYGLIELWEQRSSAHPLGGGNVIMNDAHEVQNSALSPLRLAYDSFGNNIVVQNVIDPTSMYEIVVEPASSSYEQPRSLARRFASREQSIVRTYKSVGATLLSEEQQVLWVEQRSHSLRVHHAVEALDDVGAFGASGAPVSGVVQGGVLVPTTTVQTEVSLQAVESAQSDRVAVSILNNGATFSGLGIAADADGYRYKIKRGLTLDGKNTTAAAATRFYAEVDDAGLLGAATGVESHRALRHVSVRTLQKGSQRLPVLDLTGEEVAGYDSNYGYLPVGLENVGHTIGHGLSWYLGMMHQLHAGVGVRRHPAPIGVLRDGTLVYPPFGLVDPQDLSSGLRMMVSSYRIKASSSASTLAESGVWGVASARAGGLYAFSASLADKRAIASTVALPGALISDWEYVTYSHGGQTLPVGDLNELNMRLTRTEESPAAAVWVAYMTMAPQAIVDGVYNGMWTRNGSSPALQSLTASLYGGPPSLYVSNLTATSPSARGDALSQLMHAIDVTRLDALQLPLSVMYPGVLPYQIGDAPAYFRHQVRESSGFERMVARVRPTGASPFVVVPLPDSVARALPECADMRVYVREVVDPSSASEFPGGALGQCSEPITLVHTTGSVSMRGAPFVVSGRVTFDRADVLSQKDVAVGQQEVEVQWQMPAVARAAARSDYNVFVSELAALDTPLVSTAVSAFSESLTFKPGSLQTDGVTLSFWARYPAFAADGAPSGAVYPIIKFGGGDASGLLSLSYGVSSNALVWQLSGADTFSVSGADAYRSTASDGAAYRHFVLTLSSSVVESVRVNSWSMYVNGELRHSTTTNKTWSPSTFVDVSNNLRCNAHASIKSVCVYNRALDATETSALYCAGAASTPWSFTYESVAASSGSSEGLYAEVSVRTLDGSYYMRRLGAEEVPFVLSSRSRYGLDADDSVTLSVMNSKLIRMFASFDVSTGSSVGSDSNIRFVVDVKLKRARLVDGAETTEVLDSLFRSINPLLDTVYTAV